MAGIDLFDKIIIDGNEINIENIDNNNGKYNLSPGKHEIQYIFKENNTEIPSNLFKNCSSLTHLEIPKQFTIADYALDGTSLDNINDYILNFPSSYYCDKYYLYLGPIKPTQENIGDLFNNEKYTKVWSISELDDQTLLPKRDSSDTETSNKYTINIDATNNGKIYLVTCWGASIDSNLTWPGIYTPSAPYTNPNESYSIDILYDNYTTINFGYVKYFVYEINTEEIGDYTIRYLNNNGFMGIVIKNNYTLFDENNEVISNGTCLISESFFKYYKDIKYKEIILETNNEFVYILNDEYNGSNQELLYDVYDDHLIKTNYKIKIEDQIAESLN